MSEDFEEQTTGADENSAAAFVTVLVAAREAARLSHAQVAAELRLEVPVVVALDTADFSALGAPVFIKGHLRAYEKLLRLPPNELVVLYERIEPVTDEWRAAPPRQEVVKPANLAQWGLLAVLVLAVVAVAAFLLSGSPESAPESANMPAESIPAPLVLPAEPNESGVAVPAGGAPTDATETTASALQTEPMSDTTRVSLVFTDDCWVEVADANGRVLGADVINAGSRREFSGVAPFSFVLGNAEAVELSFDGVPYNIPVWSIRDKAARFKLTAADIAALKGSSE